MKRGTLPSLLLALALLLTACGGAQQAESAPPSASPAPEAEETAVPMAFVLPCYPSGGFHPITGTNRTNLTLAPLLYRGLFFIDAQFQPQGELCQSFTVSEDGLSWTFQLAPASFSDGSPLTSAEAAASLELARKSERYAARLSAVSRVTAGADAVTVTLSKPNGNLPALLDVPIVKETVDPLRPLGTGPYALDAAGETLRLIARTGAGVPLAEIPLHAIGASDDLVYAFDAREISLVDTDLTGTSALGYSGRFETTDYATSTLLYVGFNAQSGPCRDELVRRAVSCAFDRSGIAGSLLAGHAAAAALPVHPDAAESAAGPEAALEADPEQARSLLEQAGWTGQAGEKLRKGRSALELTLAVNLESTYKVAVAESLAAALEALGCTVTVSKLPWDSFLSALQKRSFDLYLGETTLTADFDPEPLVGSAGALNYGGFLDSETNALLDAWRGAAGADRTAAAAALQARLTQTAPIAPLCFKNGSLLTQWGQVSGAQPTQRDVFAALSGWQIAQF